VRHNERHNRNYYRIRLIVSLLQERVRFGKISAVVEHAKLFLIMVFSSYQLFKAPLIPNQINTKFLHGGEGETSLFNYL